MTSPVLEYPDCPLARFDWKATPHDILCALRDVFGVSHPFLMDASFDALAENIGGEVAYLAVDYFGQEISSHGTAMIRIDESNTEYCIALVPLAEHKNFITTTQNRAKHIARVCKQNYKKLGTAAKRVDLSKRMQADSFMLEKFLDIPYSPLLTTNFAAHSPYAFCFRLGESGQSRRTTWLDLSVWPPRFSPCSQRVYHIAYSPQCGYWAVLLGVPKSDIPAENYLPSGKSRWGGTVSLTTNPPDEASWRSIPFPADSEATFSSVFFINSDLFFVQGNGLWVLQNAPNIPPDRAVEMWQKLVTCEADCSAQGLTTGDGKHYIAVGGALYSWQGGQCTRLEWAWRTDWTSTSAPYGEHSILYVDKGWRIIELNMQTGAERFRSLDIDVAITDVIPLEGGWLALLTHRNGGRDVPVALFWNPQSDEWVPMFRSALGYYSLGHMQLCTDGSVLIQTNANAQIFRITNLLEQARALKGKKQVCVGEWSDDSEEGSKEWFNAALQKELGLPDLRRVEPVPHGNAIISSSEGIFWVAKAEGLWNKIHKDRKAERPAHKEIITGDGGCEYRVFRMHSLDNMEFYCAYPPLEGEGYQAPEGADSMAVECPSEGAENTSSPAPPIPVERIGLHRTIIAGSLRLCARILRGLVRLLDRS